MKGLYDSRKEHNISTETEMQDISQDKDTCGREQTNTNSVDRITLQNGKWIRDNSAKKNWHEQVKTFDSYAIYRENYKGELRVRIVINYGDRIVKRESNIIKLMSYLHKNGIRNITKTDQKSINKIDIIFDPQMANKCLDIINKNNEKNFKTEGYICQDIIVRKGIIVDWDKEDRLEELAEALDKENQVINIERLQKKYRDKEGNIKQTITNAILIIMAKKDLPNYLQLYDNTISIKIRPYIANVVQCFKCFKYGHLAKFCRGKKICIICSKEAHGICDEKEPKCINCGGNHKSTDKGCVTFIYNRNIKKLMAKHNCGFWEAKKRMEQDTQRITRTG